MIVRLGSLQKQLSSLKSQAIDTFSRKAIDRASHALADTANPLRLNFFSTAMRILFEHMMGKLSPLDEVSRSPWFKPEQENGNPTRWQRIIFAIQGGFTDVFVTDQLGVMVAPLRKKLLAAVDDLSKNVHGREDTMIDDLEEQNARAALAVTALQNFLTAYHDCRSAIVAPIQEHLDRVAVDALISEALLEVDELAPHHSVDEIYVENVSVATIKSDAIVYRVTGTVSVTLQWGSNSDLARGDGAELGQDFPFQCDIEVLLDDDPFDVGRGESTYFVDTSSWRDAMQPDEH
jgi:Predicted pPIWI-associating nuclease